jgi:hypothetical protein
MKATISLLFLLAATALAQNTTTTAAAPGCGTTDTRFEIKKDKSQHPSAPPEPGKAVIYFVEDDTEFQAVPNPTTRIGLDGTWIGANHGNSYFYVSVEPGEHHICASWQGWRVLRTTPQSAAAHFTAEAGQSYYFTVKNTLLREIMIPKIELLPLDSDQGQLLASEFAFGTSHAK